MNQREMWLQANRQLLAKALGELSFEQILNPLEDEPARLAQPTSYSVQLKTGIVYRFKAWKTVWDHLRVVPSSIERICGENPVGADSTGQFFIDAQTDLEMTDIVLGNFLEEMHSTLFSDMKLLAKTEGLSVDELSLWKGARVQSVLNGHPKIVLNKGRIGWGSEELESYAPESETPFQLTWVAIAKPHLTYGLGANVDSTSLLQDCMDEKDLADLMATLRTQVTNTDDYLVLPVHPWQWNRFIRVQFAGDIALGKIVPLGTKGDHYLPQISIRTLTNVSRPGKPDIKLPLSILNTSAIRGLSPRYISAAPRISATLAQLCETDPVLKNSGTRVLEEKAGISCEHSHFSQVKSAPYRYHEYFGAIWRENAEAQLSENEIAIITGSLFHQDQQGQSLVGAYIHRSGLKTSEWLQRYFEAVIVPLYHLQLKYGLGLVAHGQNVVLKLKDFAPGGVFLKDFQGDLRISEKAPLTQTPEVAALSEDLGKLPPHYLIHDLITGHFLTVLRFVSATLQESEGFPETEFYALMRASIERYIKCHVTAQTPPGRIPKDLDLLSEQFHRVLLNKVRFKIGYADSAERPLPMLGEDLINPLHHPLQNGGSNGDL